MITIDIVTPARRLVDAAKATSLRVPSADGELTVLPHHAEMIALLGTGILSFTQDGGERRFAVSYGYLEVRQDKVIVMAETCEESGDVDRVRAIAAQKKAEEMLAGQTLTDESFRKYQLKLERALVRQRISPQ